MLHVMVMARVADLVIGRTRDFAQSRMLAVAMARHRPSDCRRQQLFLALWLKVAITIPFVVLALSTRRRVAGRLRRRTGAGRCRGPVGG